MSGFDDFNADINSSDDGDEIEVTAKEVYDKLIEAWLNEKFAPELLESQAELVECMLAQVKEIENNFTKKDKDLTSSLQKIELERVKFLIASYLRERLKKIEQFVVYLLQQEAKNDTPKMSAEELKFAKTFADSMQKHLNSLVLHQMPYNMQSLKQEKNPKPNMDAFVFMKVNERQEHILLDPEDEPSDLEEGSRHILRYQPIASLVETSAVSLEKHGCNATMYIEDPSPNDTICIKMYNYITVVRHHLFQPKALKLKYTSN